ncbi:hypothetical protein DH2020_048478 [Rehmannia glutinosa]|uniref:CRM domain-containing protein n=1 Tax=Rehmannia glutinosa TaxID=99300 RepID=A0ABR0U6G0_REHGL
MTLAASIASFARNGVVALGHDRGDEVVGYGRLGLGVDKPLPPPQDSGQNTPSYLLPLSTHSPQQEYHFSIGAPIPNPKTIQTPYRPPSSLERSDPPIRSDLPFDFRFSYTESSARVRPIGLREPKYSPFGPGRVDRVWTGVCAPAVDPKVGSAEVENDLEEKRRLMRERVQGEPLTNAERKPLVERCQRHKTKRQINLVNIGRVVEQLEVYFVWKHWSYDANYDPEVLSDAHVRRDGLTHNMLNDIHNNWKHAEAVRIKCMGVPTVDMKNICNQLEDKTFGQIIHRHGGLLVLYRGRYYKPKERPVIPLMLWKPQEPVYPRLVKTTIDGLSIEETKEMRKRGLSVPALTKLAKNGYYGSLVPMVRDAFICDELVRIDCKGLPKSDYKKLGCKLRAITLCRLGRWALRHDLASAIALITMALSFLVFSSRLTRSRLSYGEARTTNPQKAVYFLKERESFDDPSNDPHENDSTDYKQGKTDVDSGDSDDEQSSHQDYVCFKTFLLSNNHKLNN